MIIPAADHGCLINKIPESGRSDQSAPAPLLSTMTPRNSNLRLAFRALPHPESASA